MMKAAHGENIARTNFILCWGSLTVYSSLEQKQAYPAGINCGYMV